MTPILTARQCGNSEMLKDILSIHARPESRILDMTYGEGAFWREIDATQYGLVTNDLHKPADHHFDFRRIPLPPESFDVVVLDPPYVHGSRTVHKSLADQYGLRPRTEKRALKTDWGWTPMPMSARDITKMYGYGAKEALRLLKMDGILIIKTQDEIESGKQVWRHLDLKRLYGFKLIDLFVLVQIGKPMMRHNYQKHARKNHSYFMVYKKVTPYGLVEVKPKGPPKDSGW
jgi:hypothetical protein